MAEKKKKEFRINPSGNNINKQKFNITWIYVIMLIGIFFLYFTGNKDSKVDKEVVLYWVEVHKDELDQIFKTEEPFKISGYTGA